MAMSETLEETKEESPAGKKENKVETATSAQVSRTFRTEALTL